MRCSSGIESVVGRKQKVHSPVSLYNRLKLCVIDTRVVSTTFSDASSNHVDASTQGVHVAAAVQVRISRCLFVCSFVTLVNFECGDNVNSTGMLPKCGLYMHGSVCL